MKTGIAILMLGVMWPVMGSGEDFTLQFEVRITALEAKVNELETKIAHLETVTSLLMAVNQSERLAREYREAIARGEAAP